MTKPSSPSMSSFTAHGASIEYNVQGEGEPMLLIHGALIADSWAPVLDRLSERYRVIYYYRRGFRSSAPVREANTVTAEAADAAALLEHLDIEKAHVAGHSFGAITSLQLAVDHPERIHALAVLEPALLSVPAGAEFGTGVQAIAELFTSGHAKQALDTFLNAVGGDDAEARLNETLAPGWYEAALEDLAALFTGDLVALGEWQFGPNELRSITAPTLAVLGSDSPPVFSQTHRILMDHLPDAESFELRGATHILQMANPGDMAERLVDFFAAHPIP